MPEEFIRCYHAGGKIITKDLGDGKYLKVCYPKGGGKPIPGHVEHRKKS